MVALSWPGHYQTPWMPVFSSFVDWGIDSHSPGNDCHTSAKSQPPTGADHIKQGCQGALLMNRGNKHLLILTYSYTPDTHRCAPSHCLHWEKMYCANPVSSSVYPPTPSSLVSPSLCQVVLVLTSSLWRHKGLLKVFKSSLWTRDKGRLALPGVRKCTECEWHKFSFTFNGSRIWFSLNCVRYELIKVGRKAEQYVFQQV